jgi:uncharacterized protein (TIGR01777 family)
MDFAVTGASGLIGRTLVDRMRLQGHLVRRLVRSRSQAQPGDVFWDPAAGEVDLDALAGVDGVVHLAGAGVADHRWTDSYRRTILDSRVEGTRTIVRAMSALDPKPLVLVSASAIGYYGDRGGELLTESSSPGSGFLADVTRAWEHEAMEVEKAGIRGVTARSGIVMSRSGGALGRLLPLIRLGAGGPLGPGRQWWSWITLEDEVRALQFLLLADDTSGPVNLTAPQPVRQVELVNALARVARRPSFLPTPSLALRLILGQMAQEMVLASQRVLPGKLDQAGFDFIHDDIDAAASWVMRTD